MGKLERHLLCFGAVCLITVGLPKTGEVLGAQTPLQLHQPDLQSNQLPPPRSMAPPPARLGSPIYSVSKEAPQLAPGQPEPTNKTMPINLATALRLADARPLVIAGAQAAVQAEVARLQQAEVMWLPTIYLGTAYARFDGATQGTSGSFLINTREELMAGGGATAVFAAADAIFLPLAQRQLVRAREFDVQRARNDALEEVGETYFNVQQSRGRLAGAQDSLEKAKDLQKRVSGLGKGLVPPVELDRARTETADLEQALAQAYEDWRTTSADLTRVLRLDPTALLMPQEPPYVQVTLVSPQEPVDNLVPIGLTNRPELATQQALVQAALYRLRQERIRPLIPSLVLAGDAAPAAPGGYLADGAFLSGSHGTGNPTGFRNDWSVQVLWELRNLGFGNHALVREREAQQQQSLIDLFKVQDMVAAEVVRAHAQVQSAQLRVQQAETGVKEAQVTFAGNLKGLEQTTRAGDILVLVTRPQEAVAALQQLARSYDNYFISVGDYNRAEFRLFRALGFAAEVLAWDRTTGSILPVDTTRPPQMAPVEPIFPWNCPR
jgi:outer membrane protein TolC